MKTFLKIFGALFLAFVLYITYMVAFPVSPKETVNYSADNSDFEVIYSRPFKNERLIFGSQEEGALVPFGKYWRTGANAATTFETSSGIMFNDQKLDAGKYRLYTIPGEDSWQIILNSESDKFFAISEPDYSKDVIKTSIMPTIKEKNTVEQFTIGFSKNTIGVEMYLMWDATVVSIPLK
tara:strand:+ start:648 stop:1187 length:540 start_codon:yes stop_codon:yes gene_type:complete